MLSTNPQLTIAQANKLLRWRREGRTLEAIARRTGLSEAEVLAAYGLLGVGAPVSEPDALPEELRGAPPMQPRDWRQHYGEDDR